MRKLTKREEFGGYRSLNEWVFAETLKRMRIKFRYEPHTLILIPSFQGTTTYRKEKTYKPDFMFVWNEQTFVIETKGFARADDQTIFKLADRHYVRMNAQHQLRIRYYVVNQFKARKDKRVNPRDEFENANFYVYNKATKDAVQANKPTASFWAEIGMDGTTARQSYRAAVLAVKQAHKEVKARAKNN